MAAATLASMLTFDLDDFDGEAIRSFALAKMIDDVASMDSDDVVITRGGKPVAVIVSYDWFVDATDRIARHDAERR